MIGALVAVVAGLGYVAYRLSLSIRAVRARRAGDEHCSDRLRARAFWVYRGYIGLITVALVFLVVVAVVAQH